MTNSLFRMAGRIPKVRGAAAFIIILLIVQWAHGQAMPQAVLDEDSYVIYSVIMRDQWPVRVAKAKRLVIHAETVLYPGGDSYRLICLKPAPAVEATVGPLIQAYLDANLQTRSLERKFLIDRPYELIPSARITSIFKQKRDDVWRAFYEEYPDSGGLINMSAVGFNKDRTLALVYMGHGCGFTCGGGQFHSLEKKNGNWEKIQWRGNDCAWKS